MMPAGYPYTLAVAVLDAVAAHYASEGVALPDRRLVVPGLPAADCEMVAVHLERIYPHAGSPGTEALGALPGAVEYQLRGAAVAVYLLRCVPGPDFQGNPPASADEEAAAEAILNDVALVQAAVIAAGSAGDLPGCGAVVWEAWESITPEGLLGGGVTRFRLSLE